MNFGFSLMKVCSALHYGGSFMIKTLSRSLREYKKGSVLTILLSVLEAAFEITIPLCMAKVIDEGIDFGNMNSVWKYGIILLIFALFQLITGFLSAHIAARTSAGFCANLRQDMYDNVQTFAFSNIDKFSTASIVTRLTTDVTNIQKRLSNAHPYGNQRLRYAPIFHDCFIQNQQHHCVDFSCGHSHYGIFVIFDYP